MLGDDFDSAVTVETDPLEELASVSRTHSVAAQIVFRQWAEVVVFYIFKELLPPLLLFVF